MHTPDTPESPATPDQWLDKWGRDLAGDLQVKLPWYWRFAYFFPARICVYYAAAERDRPPALVWLGIAAVNVAIWLTVAFAAGLPLALIMSPSANTGGWEFLAFTATLLLVVNNFRLSWECDPGPG